MIAMVLLLAACDTKLATPEKIHCSYTQTKQAKLFKKKMTSKGELWVSNDSLRFDTFVVSGGVAKMKSGDHVDTLPIDKLPKVNAFLGAFSGLFVGRLSDLEKDFTLTCKDPALLELTPKSDAFAFLSSIKLGVAGGKLKTLELAEKNGDVATIVLDQCDDKVPAGIYELR